MSALLLATITVPKIDYTTILPELILLGGMLVLLLASALVARPIPTEWYAVLTIGFGSVALAVSLILWHDVTDHGPFLAVAKSIDVDGFAAFSMVLVSGVLIIGAMFAAAFLRREGIVGCEYYVLAMISASGAMIMASSNDLILIFLGLEILSIPLYVLAGFDTNREGSREAAMKYFILGAFSSAIFVYGIALTYGATGSTNIGQIAAFLSRNVVTNNGVLLGGLGLLIVGFGFKVAAVPFHMWTPDVYEGAPTPAVGFMAAIAKVGGFTALLRVLISAFPTYSSSWQPVIFVIAVITLLLGAVVALVQTNVKRMLAYSSINHAGFILLGLQAGTTRGVSSSLYYLFAYSFLALGSFGVVAVVGGTGDSGHSIDNYRGLYRRNPVLAVVFAVLLLGQAGAPFTTGFFAKLYVLQAAASAHSYALTVIAMGSAGIAVFFYLRVVLLMLTDSPATDAATPTPGELLASSSLVELAPIGTTAGSGGVAVATELELTTSPPRVVVGPWATTGLAITVLTSVVFGFWPQPLVDFAHAASLIF
jgi:NADH-quinone oxidoreductase subunit N